MGLFDAMIGQLTGKNSAGGSPQAMLAQAVMAMLSNPSSSVGGIGGLISKFQAAGLGGIIQSWISPGTNESITPDQIASGFGPDAIKSLAESAGMPAGKVTDTLSTMLPALVDKLSPDGKLLDNASMISGATTMLGNMFGHK